jgi:lipopolysaccharide transport system ATP-binding protein
LTDIVIRAEHVSKRYTLGETITREKQLAGRLTRLFRRGAATVAPSEPDVIWALDDVSFDVKQGEVLGVIGRNGAGKSTLLKLLSRITAPTTGQIEIRGRVGSLLEVGTGFHPEMTGRENIFMNAAILGMSRQEIRRKFDEIVAFAEVDRFIDTPVKRYSSGMTVRLAFAVAAHIEPEILIVDEVLAVGDVAFQRKCLGKMENVASEGRTVFFVSHNMSAIENLCTRCLFLEKGKIVTDGNTNEVITRYLNHVHQRMEVHVADRTDRKGDGSLKVTSIYLEDANGQLITQPRSGQDYYFCFAYEHNHPNPRRVKVGFGIQDTHGRPVFRASNEASSTEMSMIPPRGVFKCLVPRLPLIQGEFVIGYVVHINDQIVDYIDESARLHVERGDFFGNGHIEEHAAMMTLNYWSLEPMTEPALGEHAH